MALINHTVQIDKPPAKAGRADVAPSRALLAGVSVAPKLFPGRRIGGCDVVGAYNKDFVASVVLVQQRRTV